MRCHKEEDASRSYAGYPGESPELNEYQYRYGLRMTFRKSNAGVLKKKKQPTKKQQKRMPGLELGEIHEGKLFSSC